MQILHCWQNIKFSTPFLFTVFILTWKETVVLSARCAVWNLLRRGTLGSGQSFVHSMAEAPFLSTAETEHEMYVGTFFISKRGSRSRHATVQQQMSPPTGQPTRRKEVYQVTVVLDRFTIKQLNFCVQANCVLGTHNVLGNPNLSFLHTDLTTDGPGLHDPAVSSLSRGTFYFYF